MPAATRPPISDGPAAARALLDDPAAVQALIDDPEWQRFRHQAHQKIAIARGETQTPAAPRQPTTPQPAAMPKPAATPGDTVAAHGANLGQPATPQPAGHATPTAETKTPRPAGQDTLAAEKAQVLLQKHFARGGAQMPVAPRQPAMPQPAVTPQPATLDSQAADKARALLDDPKWQSPSHQAILQKAIARGEAQTQATPRQPATPQTAAVKPATLDVRPAAPQPQQPPSPGGAASAAPAPQSKGGGQGGGVTVNNNVTVTGVGLEHVQQLVKTALDAFSRDLESKLSAMRAQQMRLSYGG
jgi:hypothetical protein